MIQAVTVLLVAAGGIAWFSMRGNSGRPDETSGAESGTSLRTKAEQRASAGLDRDRRRQEAIADAAQMRYEQLLEIYPDMRPEFRDVPDAANGFLQFLLLAESKEVPELPREIDDMFFDKAPWDPVKFEAWLAENKDQLDEIVRIAELPEQSAKGIDFDRFCNGARLTTAYGKILNGSALLAFGKGDQASALRYAKAAIRLGDHLTGVEAPSMLGKVIAQGYRGSLRDLFANSMLPALSNDPQALQTWREVLFQKQDTAADYGQLLTGEWNNLIRANVLPAMLGAENSQPGAPSFDVPDPDAYFQQYTEATRRLAASFAKAGPGRIDLSQSDLEFPESGIDAKTLHVLQETGKMYRGLFKAFGIRTTKEAMISAAIAIQLGEDAGVDPVSGNPFQWDATSRTLTSPAGMGDPDSIQLR
ncbi:MAG: hypothetical protein EOP87_12790 [Verrucomicrobiaceae bacterium]|nr:MAG: hypothetical protein EOP87_12790 [Verrucomicrobiaceae bacterium]